MTQNPAKEEIIWRKQSVVLDVSDAAQFLKTTKRTIEEAARRGEIGKKVGKSWRFHRQDLLNWIRGGRSNHQSDNKPPKDNDTPEPPDPVPPADWTKPRKLSFEKSSGSDTVAKQDAGVARGRRQKCRA